MATMPSGSANGPPSHASTRLSTSAPPERPLAAAATVPMPIPMPTTVRTNHTVATTVLTSRCARARHGVESEASSQHW